MPTQLLTITIRNIKENESGRMEGEVYLGAIKQNIIVMFDKKAPIDYVKSQLEYLWSLDDKIIKKMCFYANLYRKDIMEECPDQDYPEGLERVKDPLELWEYMGITSLKVDLYKNEDVKIISFNLSIINFIISNIKFIISYNLNFFYKF